MTIEEKVKLIKDALDDKRAEEVKAYDVRGISGLTDAFIVATGSAAPHLRSLALASQQAVKGVGGKIFRNSGDPESGWIVVDLIDVVVHLFSPEARAYYALEKLWENAKPL